MATHARRLLTILAVLLLLTPPTWAETCKGSRVKKALLQTYDSHLVLTQGEANAAIAEHLPWGTPACGKILALKEYVVCYDADHRVPSCRLPAAR